MSCTEFGSEVKDTPGDTATALEDLAITSEESATEDVPGSDEKVESSTCSVTIGVHDTRLADGVSGNCECSEPLVWGSFASSVRGLAEILVADPCPDTLSSVGNAGCEFKEALQEAPGS